MIVSLANPYWIIWWMTVGLGLALSARQTGMFAVFVFFFGHISADFVWNSAVSCAIAKNRRFISDRGYTALLFTCAITLACFGIYFLAGIIPFLFPGR
jgi:threonine/homoserine/homoserine lactone efflux protein